MAGVKGKSGRRAAYYDIRIQELQNVSVNYLIDNFDTFDPAEKLKIAMTIASKCVVQKIETKGETTHLIGLIHDYDAERRANQRALLNPN